MKFAACTQAIPKFLFRNPAFRSARVLVTRTTTTKNREMPTARPQHRGKLAVSYGWASPVTRKRSAQSSRFQTLIKYFNLYCKHSSMMGLKYLVEDRATWTMRMLWLIAYFIIMWLMWIYVPLICSDYFDTAITATPESDDFPTEYIEFPGIAICSVNRISHRKATMLAADMYNANVSNMTVDEILHAIKDLGYLYNTHFKREEGYTEISRLLSIFYGGHYNISEIMEYLTPECSSLLMTCVLRGEEKNCSDIFSVSKTQDGFCCTFNYFSDDDDNRTYELAQEVGEQYGLIVTMDPMLDDYFYSVIPIIGFKVMVFRPRDYPDTLSGGVSEMLVTPLTKRYVQLTALGLSSSDSIRPYPANNRKCIFADEKSPIHKSYTSSDCIVACRIKDLWEYCKCRPFFYPDFGLEQQYNRTCTVEDVPCVDKYKDDRHDLVPYQTEALSHLIKKNTTLYCEACYPPCDDVTYIITTSTHSVKPKHFDTTPSTHANYSILHIFFAHGGTLYLRQDVSYKWYQYLSDIGGICEFFLGCSLISFVELVYFILLCLTELLTSDSDPEANEEVENQPVQPSMQVIYWNELFPRSRTTKPLKRIRKAL
ncbi:sodium channel protein Nach-like [Halictus rubicundus]|uniref:sodium channel protein Nach-like n=1 Tax=Halictus rubicundus TaxID=77578 RepID=UPI0040351687